MKTMSRSKLKHRTTAHNKRMEKVERNREICELRRQGLTLESIGERFDISMQAAWKIWRRDREKYTDG